MDIAESLTKTGWDIAIQTDEEYVEFIFSIGNITSMIRTFKLDYILNSDVTDYSILKKELNKKYDERKK